MTAAARVKALDVLGYRRLWRHERPAALDPPPLAPDTGVEVGFFGLEEFLAVSAPVSRSEAERRLAAGERILGYRLHGEPAGVLWLATGTVRVPYLRWQMPLAPGELYGYDGWTALPMRGRGLTSHRFRAVVKLAREEGMRVVVAHHWGENAHAMEAARRRGYAPVALDMAFRLPGRTIHRSRPIAQGRAANPRFPVRGSNL